MSDDLARAMADVERHSARWHHVHEWFHATRVNPNCAWCAEAARRDVPEGEQ